MYVNGNVDIVKNAYVWDFFDYFKKNTLIISDVEKMVLEAILFTGLENYTS